MTGSPGEKESEGGRPGREVWLLVDHSSAEASLVPVVGELEERGFSVELVTITEVIGNVAREALAGGAERLLRGLRVATRGGSGDEDLIGAIRRRQPDMLVVTQPRYARAIGVLENLTGVESLQVGLVSDFYIDSRWFSGQLHAMIIPDDTMRADVVDRGLPEERVKVAGPALRPGFGDGFDRGKVRSEMGFDEGEMVVLVRADGFDIATLEKAVFQCTLSDREARFVFHHDGDGATAAALRRAADQYGLPAAMFGRVPDLERYFAAADAVLAAEDDPYIAELLESETPSLLVGVQRRTAGNGEALSARELSGFLDDVGQLGTRLDRFLGDQALDGMREALGEWDGRKRHDRLAGVLEEIAEHAEEWRRPVRPAPSADGEEERETPDAADFRGPFETIGTGAAGADGERTDRGADAGGEAAGVRRDYATLSRAEAKDQLAELILKEREAERRLEELEKQQQRWRGRLELAREWNETELVDEAKSILRGYVDEAEPLEQRLDDIGRQKEKLKEAARTGSGAAGQEDFDDVSDRASRLEERFQEMEVDRDLEGLKDRIRRELGE